MQSRSWGMLVLLLAFAAGAVAHTLHLDSCITFAVVLIFGLIGVCAIVVTGARRKLAENRARLMRAAQMCPKCGYSIRVNTDRCPECGEPVER